MAAPLASKEDVERADAEAVRRLDKMLRPSLTWRGVLGVALLSSAVVLIWRKP